MVTVAAALLTGAALAGCGPAGPIPSVTPPPADAEPPAVVAPPPATELPPLSPPIEVPLEPVPTVVGPYVPPPAPSAPATPPRSAGTPAPVSTPTPTPTPTATPDPRPAALIDLLPAAAGLPPLTWTDADGERTAAWSELAAPREVDTATAIAHVAAARGAGGSCAAAADAVDGSALAAAAVSLAADPAPGAPFDLVLLRYPAPEAAADALAALHALGTACEGVETEDGVLGGLDGPHGAAVVLRAGQAALVAEAVAVDALLVTVLHEGGPPEAVAMLLDSVR